MLNMKPSSVCRLEKGNCLPDPDTLTAIERALDLPVGSYTEIRKQINEDICYDDSEIFDDPEIRFAPIFQDHTVPPAELAELTSALDKRVREYADCEKKLKIPSFCRLNMGNLPMTDAYNGIDAAWVFRTKLCIGDAPLRSLIPTLEQMNIRFIPVDRLPPILLDDGATRQRHSFPVHDMRYDNLVIAINSQSAPQSQLYDIAYSLGAYFRYRRFQARRTNPKKDGSTFCRAFAAALLAPREPVNELLGLLRINKKNLSLAVLDNIAARFDVSSMMMLNTLRGYKCINDDTFKRLLERLKDPEIYKSPSGLKDRPPLPFGRWLRTLKLASRRFD